MNDPSASAFICVSVENLCIWWETLCGHIHDPHVTYKVRSLPNADLPNMLFSRNLTPVLDEGLQYTEL
jgi:hypothetical protein